MNLCKRSENLFFNNPKMMTNKLSNLFDSKKNYNDQDKHKILMRDYVNHKLYDESYGYYSGKNTNPIGRLDIPINFKEMRGISDYSYELNVKYPKSTWMTAPELLRPYFGFALGNYIDKNFRTIKSLNKSSINSNIKIFEVGCGMGGAIDSILEYLKNFSIKEYREVEYVGLELNPTLANATREILKKNHPILYEKGKISILNQSLFDFENNILDDENTYILALNYFNSTPHDKILFEKNYESILRKEINNYPPFFQKFKKHEDINKSLHSYYQEFLMKFLERNKGIVKETHVELKYNIDQNDINLKQVFEDLKDDKIIDMLIYYIFPEEVQEYILGEQLYNIEKSRQKKSEDWFIKMIKNFYQKYNDENKLWIPSTKNEFFEKIEVLFPQNNIIILDFDVLPSKIFKCDYKGKNAPVVYSIVENSLKTKTYNSIFESWETTGLPVNVYFPIDFQNLLLYNKIKTGKNCSLNKFNYFMNEHSMNEWCESKSGFNPLIHTHHNTTFMLSLI